MSRNRLTTKCDCGHRLVLGDAFTRPLYFDEYLRLIGVDDPSSYPYYSEYRDIIGCGVSCPECGLRYYFWLGGRQFVAMEGVWYDQRFGDTSYWETFNDEPLHRERQEVPMETQGEARE